MEKMLIKGRKYETDKKESKWFVQDSDEHTEDLAAGSRKNSLYLVKLRIFLELMRSLVHQKN